MFQGEWLLRTGPLILALLESTDSDFPRKNGSLILVHCGSLWCWPLRPPRPLRSNESAVRCTLGILRVRMQLVCFTALYLCLLMYDLVPGILLTESPKLLRVCTELNSSRVVMDCCVVGRAATYYVVCPCNANVDTTAVVEYYFSS